MTKTMKKILSVCLVVLMCMTAAPLDGFVGLDLGFGTKASASDIPATGKLGENITYTFDEATGALTISGSGDMDDSLTSAALFAWSKIKSVTISEGITSLGKNLFDTATKLKSVTLPTTLKKIGKEAFAFTYSLESITLPDNLETICEGAFFNSGLTDITISKGVKTIELDAFATCHDLTNLTVDPDNENYASVDNVLFNKDKTTLVWYSCGNSAESYTIPAGVKTIAEKAFYQNFNIKSIIMTDDVETIGNTAFERCTALSSVTLSNKLTTISQSAFYLCKIESIIIPEGVTKIEANAFNSCSNLKTITLPSTLTEIGNNAFVSNSALSDVNYTGTEETWNNITIGYSNDNLKNAERHYIDAAKKIGNGVNYEFDSTSGVLTVYGIGDMYDFDWDTAKFQDIKNDVKSIVISNGVTSIGEFAFAYCTSNVENISIAKSVTKIGKAAFMGCSKLTSLVIPDGVKSIESNAFRNGHNIESLTLYGNLTSIADSAFAMDAAEELFKLESIYYLGTAEQHEALSIGEHNEFITRDAVNVYYHVTGKLGDNITYTIDPTTGILTVSGTGSTYDYPGESSPLYGNKNIKKIVIESGVTIIDLGVFAACGVEEVTFPDTVNSIYADAFEDCTALKQVELSASVIQIDHHAFSGCTALEKFIVPDDNNAFKSVDGVLFSKDGKTLCKYPAGKEATAYTVPETVETVYHSAFSDSKKLVSIDFENDDTAISNNAFEYCTALENISLPKNLTCINAYLFYDCSSLKEISIPAGVTEIGIYAFANATSLEFVTIPNGVNVIAGRAFWKCSSLKGVLIPSSVNTIESEAFDGATALTDVYYFGTEETWNSITIGSNNEPLKNATIHYLGDESKLGDNVYYIFDSATGELTVFGTGATYDYSVGETSGDSPLYGNKNIKKIVIESGVTGIRGGVFAACGVEEVTFSDTVKSIGNSAFQNCTALTQVNLSASVNSIDKYAFYNCSALEKISVPDDSETYKSVDGILFSKDGKTLYKYPGGKDGTAYTVPATVETVYDCAFHDSAKLVSIDFANDNTKIGTYAFAYCTALKNISLPNNLTFLKEGLFFGCSSLKEVSIPAGVKTISGSAFEYATSLEFIVLPNSIDSIANYTFFGCSSLKSVVIPSSVDTIEYGAFGATALKDVYYIGTAENWESNVYISSGNDSLTNANIIFNHIHSVSNYVVVKNGTCENGGTRNGMCVCGMCVETETISTAHTFGDVQHKNADCVNDGYDYKQCTDCKKYFTSDAAITDTNGKDDTSSFVTPATGHSDGEDGNDNLCDKCRAYIGDITLTVGTNITVPITYAYGSRDTLVKFVPDKTAQYIISSNADPDDQNTYPTMAVYSLTDGILEHVDYASGDIGENFNLSTATFIEGQVYCIAFRDYKENAEAYTVNVALGCEHPTTKQTCMGYYCETCGLYYGDRDSSKHELDTVQTCKGYKCKHCNRYFGDAAPDNHIWDTDGMCTACYTWHDHKTFDENGMCTVCKYALPYVLISGTTTTYYGTFPDALAAAKDGDTIKMQNDDASSYSSVEITKAITLDLNGHALTQPSSESFDVKANVTFTDSVGGSYCEYGIVLYTSCTFSGGGYRYIAISSDFETEDNLGDYLAACCDYYNYSFSFYDGVGTVGSLLDLSSRKNTYDIEDKVMIKANHSIIEVNAQETTCTKAGHTAGEYCENCDYTTVTKTGDATGHNFGAVQHKDADCTSGGYDYKQCSSCNKYFAPDAAITATNGKDDYSSFTTQKLNHSYTGDMKMDTDGKNGTHSFKCVNGCGQYGNATAHDWNDGEITTPATHLKEGVKTYKCACGATYTEPVSKLEGHTYTPTVVPPTCTEQGYTEHKCACGDSYKDTYVDATGHNYENGSCTECGDKDPNYTGDQGGNTGDNTSDCDCICHSSNKFVQFIYKIVRWFWKIFKIHKTCDCGAIHY